MPTKEDATEYVTNAAWHSGAARADAIDDIADQFERPGASAILTSWVTMSD